MMSRKISIAPMMDCTDKHYRYLSRLLSKRVLLYTEMITTGALINGDRERFLAFHPGEHPLAIQLGGSDRGALVRCARVAADYGYDEVNLNVGCPSDRVHSGRFGACLMANPRLVADCVAAMCDAVAVPVTVKTRIGIDDHDSYAHLSDFVLTVAASGCGTFIVHARKAWLRGLSPKQNREIPPLRYDVVYRLKRDFPALAIIINGGITTYEQIRGHLAHVDGVMIGREAYYNPYFQAELDRRFLGGNEASPSREQIVEQYLTYIEHQRQRGVPSQHMTRHLLGLYRGQPGARIWRQHLTESHRRAACSKMLHQGLELMREIAARTRPQVAAGAE